jgi:hypothetical protein
LTIDRFNHKRVVLVFLMIGVAIEVILIELVPAVVEELRIILRLE